MQAASLVLVTTPAESLAMGLRSALRPLRLLGVPIQVQHRLLCHQSGAQRVLLCQLTQVAASMLQEITLTLLLSLRCLGLVFEDLRNLVLGLAVRGIDWSQTNVLLVRAGLDSLAQQEVQCHGAAAVHDRKSICLGHLPQTSSVAAGGIPPGQSAAAEARAAQRKYGAGHAGQRLHKRAGAQHLSRGAAELRPCAGRSLCKPCTWWPGLLEAFSSLTCSDCGACQGTSKVFAVRWT